MLLLILFAGCLASCAAQTTPFPSVTMETSAVTYKESIQPTSVLQTSDSTHNVVAILQAAVQSYQELNETTITPVLTQLFGIIQQLQPDLAFSLTVKNITRV